MAEYAAVSEISDAKGVSGYKRIITRQLQSIDLDEDQLDRWTY